MKGAAGFAGVTAGIILVAGWVLTLVFPSVEARRAIVTSALVAFPVQLFGFAVVRLAARSNPIAGWGLGVILRFLVLAVYALVIVQAFTLESAPALVSLATFFFLSTLVEPLWLNA